VSNPLRGFLSPIPLIMQLQLAHWGPSMCPRQRKVYVRPLKGAGLAAAMAPERAAGAGQVRTPGVQVPPRTRWHCAPADSCQQSAPTAPFHTKPQHDGQQLTGLRVSLAASEAEYRAAGYLRAYSFYDFPPDRSEFAARVSLEGGFAMCRLTRHSGVRCQASGSVWKCAGSGWRGRGRSRQDLRSRQSRSPTHTLAQSTAGGTHHAAPGASENEGRR
jgi:hypothetical protein